MVIDFFRSFLGFIPPFYTYSSSHLYSANLSEPTIKFHLAIYKIVLITQYLNKGIAILQQFLVWLAQTCFIFNDQTIDVINDILIDTAHLLTFFFFKLPPRPTPFKIISS